MSIRDDILNDARRLAGAGFKYQMVPPPDGVHTVDCSLFVLKVLDDVGVGISGVRTAQQIRAACAPIAFDEVKPGDLLFFENTYASSEHPGSDGHVATHVGISEGAGTLRMYNANEVQDIAETRIGTPYWQSHLFEARRIPALINGDNGRTVPHPQNIEHPIGIDVASYQGRPNWNTVAGSGLVFAITKATQSTDYVNPTFGYNWSGIGATNLVRGAYHFGRPDLGNPEGEANFFLDTINRAGGLKVGDLLALDVEGDPLNEGNLDRTDDLPGWCLAFLRHVESKVGFKPLIYSNPSILTSYGFDRYSVLGNYGLWLAAYRDKMPDPPAPWNVVAFWQFSSDGNQAGVSGSVDLNLFNGKADRVKLYGKLS